MSQNKSFILKVPNFLATDAGSIFIRCIFASCYVALIIGYTMPGLGTFLATFFCLAVWQLFELVFKDKQKYKRYTLFLLQRLLFCGVFVLIMMYICTQSGSFDDAKWKIVYVVLGMLNFSDIFCSLKGITGVGFIHVSDKY